MGDDGDDVLTPLISSSPPSPLPRQRHSTAGFYVRVGVADLVLAAQFGGVPVEARIPVVWFDFTALC